MQAAAEIPTLAAICFRCQARFVGPEPSSCPGCGGAVILEMQGFRGIEPVAHSPADADADERPSFLPGVHIKLAPKARESLAASCHPVPMTRQGGGTSVYARRSRGASRREAGGWALKLVSMAALLASFAFFLQSAH